MWLCTPFGFFSITESVSGGMLQVRARDRKHLEDFMSSGGFRIPAEIVESDTTDYPYRIFLYHEDAAHLISRMVLSIGYGNFKDHVKKVRPEDDGYLNFLTATWARSIQMEPPNRFDHPFPEPKWHQPKEMK